MHLPQGASAVVAQRQIGDAGFNTDLDFGDLDNDGNLDLIVAVTQLNSNRVCYGDGTGNFGSCADIGLSRSTEGAAIGRFNGDDLNDVVFANNDSINTVCYNDGAGGFDCGNASSTSDGWRQVTSGRFDQDGMDDAPFVGFNADPEICLGGNSALSCSSISGTTGSQFHAAVGDLDNDGRLDAVLTPTFTDEIDVGLGDGLGGFTCSAFTLSRTVDRTSVDIGFVDGDGFLDVVIAADDGDNQPSGNVSIFCSGDGQGSFSSCTDLPLRGDVPAVVVGDLGPLDFRQLFEDRFESAPQAP